MSKWEYHHRRSEKLVARAMNGTQETAFPIFLKAAVAESRACSAALAVEDDGKSLIGRLVLSAMGLWLQAGRPDIAEDFAKLMLNMKNLPPETTRGVATLREFGKAYGWIPSIVTFDESPAPKVTSGVHED